MPEEKRTEKLPLMEKLTQWQTADDSSFETVEEVKAAFESLIATGFADLPFPGHGRTYQRWQVLSALSGIDLCVAKLIEAHTDALAILHELGTTSPVTPATWAVWASEPPHVRLNVVADTDGGEVVLSGKKAWCSGAGIVSHALVTAWLADGGQQLCTVDLSQGGIEIDDSGWEALGMHNTCSYLVSFHDVKALRVGKPGEYITRPGFWHGAAGVAACWYGATERLGQALRESVKKKETPFSLSHLGQVDHWLFAAKNVLKTVADWIDANPHAGADLMAGRVRSICEAAANAVMMHAGRAMGPYPYCADRQLAKLLCDLPVFLRQHHADSDWQAQGSRVAVMAGDPWKL